jgi:hypothetical protein
MPLISRGNSPKKQQKTSIFLPLLSRGFYPHHHQLPNYHRHRQSNQASLQPLPPNPLPLSNLPSPQSPFSKSSLSPRPLPRPYARSASPRSKHPPPLRQATSTATPAFTGGCPESTSDRLRLWREGAGRKGGVRTRAEGVGREGGNVEWVGVLLPVGGCWAE